MKQNLSRSGREESGRVPGSDRIRGYLSVLYSFHRPLWAFFFYFDYNLRFIFQENIYSATFEGEYTKEYPQLKGNSTLKLNF